MTNYIKTKKLIRGNYMHSMKHHKISGLNTIKKYFKTPFVQEASLIIGVSVGSKKHDGEALAALVEAINRLHKSVRITNCTLLFVIVYKDIITELMGKRMKKKRFLCQRRRVLSG
ncbi:hypothetical protein BEV13_00595 [Rickettsiella grylli]|uniref:hypothetical protein n=1 Tax=Rickettsiella grylli TaxID=59196 RepID=UPI0008FD143D|nr:hypothetical protein [Rickettsiella grylli]OJA01069.1 hypothetical protein BEV13_00595 [Rickettsiella grylli]